MSKQTKLAISSEATLFVQTFFQVFSVKRVNNIINSINTKLLFCPRYQHSRERMCVRVCVQQTLT